MLIMLPSVLGISVVLFTILALAPGDPFEELATNPAVPAEVRQMLRAKFGLDDPVWQRYFRWLAMLAGRLGLLLCQPRRRRHADTAARAGHARDHRCLAGARADGRAARRHLLGDAPVFAVRPHRQHVRLRRVFIADFFTGILFILIFSITLDWLPFVYRADLSATGWQWWWEQFKQSIMPVTVLGLFQGASWTSLCALAVLDVIRLDYVTTARSGLLERVVVMKHVVRNALIPVVTLVALTMPAVFGGAIVTEQIFRIPGIGSLLIDAILRNDTPVIMSVTFVLACLVILFNFLADLIYGWLDPRISYR